MPATDLSQQVIYKLGEVEATLEQGFKRIDQRMDQIHSDQQQLSSKLTTDVQAFDQRLDKLEIWQRDITSRFAVIGAGVIVVWTIVSAPIIKFVQDVLGMQ